MPTTNTPAKRGRPPKPKEVEADTVEQAGQEIVRQKRKRSDLENFGEERVKPGDNARFLRNALIGYSLPPIDISDPAQVEQRIKDYFLHCVEKDRKPSVVGMANWLGIDRTTLNSWDRGEYRGATHSHIVKKAMTILEELYVDYMMNGKVNPGSGCFIGKNHFGYRDVTENVLTMNNPMGAESDPTQMAQKYQKALPGAAIDAEGAEEE
ncbi:MAG: terminase small subunit [Petrimonas sp.]|jgi:hypothetical protein|nr:terminase small subunit [Petrimonas sp.]